MDMEEEEDDFHEDEDLESQLKDLFGEVMAEVQCLFLVYFFKQ